MNMMSMIILGSNPCPSLLQTSLPQPQRLRAGFLIEIMFVITIIIIVIINITVINITVIMIMIMFIR